MKSRYVEWEDVKWGNLGGIQGSWQRKGVSGIEGQCQVGEFGEFGEVGYLGFPRK